MSSADALDVVAYKRFVDYVPSAIDRELLRALEHDIEEALFAGLHVSSPNAKERCERLLAQDPSVVAARGELEARKARLEAARHELTKLWVWSDGNV